MSWDSGLLLWCGLVLLVAAAILLLAAICGEELDNDTDDSGGEPAGHKSPPHYTLDDWT